MSKPSVPQPAPPQQTSQAQTTSNVDTAIANATLGNVNQEGPLGSTTYSQNGGQWVDGNFVPSYTQTTSLNPTLQKILTGTQDTAASLLPAGQTLAGQASSSLTNPLNFSGANNDIIQAGPQALYQPVTNQVFAGEQALLQPTFTQQNRDLEDQLSRQGIPIGSEAYGNAKTQLGTQQNQALTAASGNAAATGAQTAGNMFNLALLGQNQNIGQQQTAQQNPLNNLKMLYSGTV